MFLPPPALRIGHGECQYCRDIQCLVWLATLALDYDIYSLADYWRVVRFCQFLWHTHIGSPANVISKSHIASRKKRQRERQGKVQTDKFQQTRFGHHMRNIRWFYFRKGALSLKPKIRSASKTLINVGLRPRTSKASLSGKKKQKT